MPPLTYSIAQRLLHWCVVVLIFFNLLFPDGMNRWHHLVRHGQTPTPDDISSANIHAYVGITILLLAAIRLLLRWERGVPPEPAGQPALLNMLAKLVHFLLYALLFLMPITGILAYYLGIASSGSLHADVLKIVLWAVIGLHALGALTQHFYFKSNVLRRMTTG